MALQGPRRFRGDFRYDPEDSRAPLGKTKAALSLLKLVGSLPFGKYVSSSGLFGCCPPLESIRWFSSLCLLAGRATEAQRGKGDAWGLAVL